MVAGTLGREPYFGGPPAATRVHDQARFPPSVSDPGCELVTVGSSGVFAANQCPHEIPPPLL